MTVLLWEKYLKFVFPVVFFIASSTFAAPVYADTCASQLTRDTYQSFGELSRFEIEGNDYQVAVRNTGSAISVIAPHGGRIEFGTSEIAAAIAGHDLNLYLFNGCKPGDNFCLHITSARFDEQRAVDLMSRSKLGVSIHGFTDNTQFVIIGGLNITIARQLAKSIQGEGFIVEFPATRFKGESDMNIVNRAAQNGVQIEISSALRRELLSRPYSFKKFVHAVRATLEPFLL